MTKTRGKGQDSIKDSSFIFSLEELQRMEQERVAREKEEVLRTEREMRKTEAEIEAKRIELETKRREAEEQARRAEEWREREARAREEAMIRAAVETARAEAESKARIEELKVRQAESLEIERVRETAGARRAKKQLVSAIIGAGVVVAALLGGYFGAVQPGHAKAIASLEQDVRARDDRLRDLESAGGADRARLRQLETDLATVRGKKDKLAGENAKLAGEIADLKKRHGPPPTVTTVTRRPAEDSIFLKCPPGSRDPMCVQ